MRLGWKFYAVWAFSVGLAVVAIISLLAAS